MIIIKSQQLTMLNECQHFQFIGRVMDLILQDERYKSNISFQGTDLGSQIKKSIKNCKSFSFETETDVAIFTLSSFFFGDDFFEKKNEAFQLFNNPYISKKIKIDWLNFWVDKLKISF